MIKEIWGYLRKVVVLISLAFVPLYGSASALVMGDSHAQGISIYCKHRPPVRYKVGSTTRYWYNQPTVKGVDHLYLVTGTNDGKKPDRVLQAAICKRYAKCTVVDIPRYPKYDGIHLYPSGYRRLCQSIF